MMAAMPAWRLPATSALAFAALEMVRVVYLLYMAWQALARDRGARDPTQAGPWKRSSRRVIVTRSINILNPKTVDLLPGVSCRSSSPPTRPIRWRGCWNGGVFMAHDVCGVRVLRPVRGRCPRPIITAPGHGLAAPELCGGLRGAGAKLHRGA